jgi:hypothetical protein
MNERLAPLQTDALKHELAMCEKEWPCLGVISIDAERLLVVWETEWYSSREYHALRANGHKGWIEHALLNDQFLIAWEPTIELKSVQSRVETLLEGFAIEVQRGRTGLIGYLAAKDLDDPSSDSGKRLGFLAYWRVAPMSKQQFLYLQGQFSSHHGRVVHREQDKVWIQWEPTWVYYENVDSKKRESLVRERDKPQKLLDLFHKTIVEQSTAAQVQKRLSRA